MLKYYYIRFYPPSLKCTGPVLRRCPTFVTRNCDTACVCYNVWNLLIRQIHFQFVVFHTRSGKLEVDNI